MAERKPFLNIRKRIELEDTCAHCSLNDNANCHTMPECPFNECDYCGSKEHLSADCPQLEELLEHLAATRE